VRELKLVVPLISVGLQVGERLSPDRRLAECCLFGDMRCHMSNTSALRGCFPPRAQRALALWLLDKDDLAELAGDTTLAGSRA
jgi:hypothetical protein